MNDAGDMAQNGYFSPNGIHVFAHRGFCEGGLQENTIASFSKALEAGATHLETDVQATGDGIAVLFHDDDLLRIAGVSERIDQVTLQELRAMNQQTQLIPTLQEALEALTAARFNLDLKSKASIEPAVAAVIESKAFDRVLISSFSESRRRKAMHLLSAIEVSGDSNRRRVTVTGAGLTRILGLVACSWFGWYAAFNRLSRSIDALQIPEHAGPISLKTKKLLGFAKRSGLRVYYWVVNDSQKMNELIGLGAAGVITDRVDVAVQSLRH